MSKYHARKVSICGISYDSKKEAMRHIELQLLEKAGEISNLQRQVKFVLIPEQRENTNEIIKSGKNKGHFKKGKLLERECSYIADFTYYDKDGRYIVEDVKGIQTKEFIIKRKLMLSVHGIRIKIT